MLIALLLFTSRNAWTAKQVSHSWDPFVPCAQKSSLLTFLFTLLVSEVITFFKAPRMIKLPELNNKVYLHFHAIQPQPAKEKSYCC